MNSRFEITTIIPLKYLRAILFIAIAGLALFLLLIGLRKIDLAYNPNAKNHYLASIIDKMTLVDSIKTPKLILMGGQSVAFGVDSDLLSRELEMPVVNLALDNKLGSDFMMNELKSKAKKGDVILVTLDYNVTSEGENETKLLVSDFYESANEWITYQSFFEPIVAFFSHKFEGIKLLFRHNPSQNSQDKTSLYFRKAFDKNGDLISHLNNQNTKFIASNLPTNTDFSKQIDDLNELEIFAKKQDIKILFTFASYSESGFEKNMMSIQKIEKQLNEKANFNIVGTAQYSVLDDALFFNNEYNLNSKGRKIFTYRLLQLLEQGGV
jgi:hypothetical protein